MYEGAIVGIGLGGITSSSIIAKLLGSILNFEEKVRYIGLPLSARLDFIRFSRSPLSRASAIRDSNSSLLYPAYLTLNVRVLFSSLSKRKMNYTIDYIDHLIKQTINYFIYIYLVHKSLLIIELKFKINYK